MRPLLRPSLVASALLACACMVAAHPAPPPVMPALQAVSIGTQYARSRGLAIDYTIAARLDQRARWHVELGGRGGRDYALVVVDGYSGAILRARLRAPRPTSPPEFAAPPLPPPAAPPGPPPAVAPPPPPMRPGAPPPPATGTPEAPQPPSPADPQQPPPFSPSPSP